MRNLTKFLLPFCDFFGDDLAEILYESFLMNLSLDLGILIGRILEGGWGSD